MRSKKLMSLLMVSVMMGTLVFSGCSKQEEGGNDSVNTQTEDKNSKDDSDTATDDKSENNQSNNTVEKLADVFTKFDQRDTWDADAKVIELSDGDVVIEEEGTYVLSGTLKNGQVYVNVGSEEKVQLVLNGVDITCESSAAIFVENADKVSITLAKGTTNTVSDGGNADTTDADGCIYSKDDLSINGTGTLIVKGNVSNGIDCNNDIRICGGNIEVTAVNNGIKAKQSVSIMDGTIKVKADDAIKVSDKSDETVGEFYMEGGNLELDADDDAITATVSIIVAGGQITASAGGKTTNCDGNEKIATGCLIKK